jgi:CheY-like chemotaxis protein
MNASVTESEYRMSIGQRKAKRSTNHPIHQASKKVSLHSVGSILQEGGFGPLPREDTLMSKNTLIIDDDEMSRRLLRLVLEFDGCHCVEADNGAMGLSLLESQHFDLVILDNVMPVMTGMELLSRLPHTSQNPDVPVIMVTGLLNPRIREKAIGLGAYAIIGKPYDFGELRSMVAQLCPSPVSPQRHSLFPK